QVHERELRLSTWWDLWRWRRFEKRWVRRYPRLVVMSEQDRKQLAPAPATVIPNGVDLDRFLPEIERRGRRLLFIGSFRHFPNVVAYRFLTSEIWPILRDRLPDVELTVVAGPDPLTYWREYSGLLDLPQDPRVQVLGFVADVRPLYVES